MPLSYLNRKGRTYFLHARHDRRGRIRYLFCRAAGVGALDALPAGWEVAESPNGHLSLRRLDRLGVTLEELAVLRASVAARDLGGCLCRRSGSTLVVYRPADDSEQLLRLLTGLGGHAGEQALRTGVARSRRYVAAVRLRLVDSVQRRFLVQRREGRRGRRPRWRDTARLGTLAELLATHRG